MGSHIGNLRWVAMALACFCSLLSVGWAQVENTSTAEVQIRDALQSGDLDAAVRILKTLPSGERMAWLSEMHERGASGESTQSGEPSGPRGGAAIANFRDLIRLIETTISPDQWQAAGGTATMMEFRQGVSLDPNGVIRRIKTSDKGLKPAKRPTKEDNSHSSAPIITLEQLGVWQRPSNLRWISLHALDEQLRKRQGEGMGSDVSMELLGGLYRLDYVAFDPVTQEWLLGGPAGDLGMNRFGDLLNRETNLPPLLLEDLLCVAPHVLNQRGELGCSIDPVPEKLTDAYKFATAKNVAKALQRDPEKWAEQWRETLGLQRATIVGIPSDSPTGYALLIADAHMKRIGLGLESTPDKMRNYWQEAEALGVVTNQGLVRWWFALNNAPIMVDAERKIYNFAGSNVQVMSESQLINNLGKRVVATNPDAAADAFARGFTLQFDKLQKMYPEYGRLRHIFDLAVAMEIVRSEMAHGVGRPFSILSDPEVCPKLPVAPTELESVAATHRMRDGSVSAIISGGVSINLNGISNRFRSDVVGLRKISTETSNGELLSKQSNEEFANAAIGPKRETIFWRE